LGTLKRIAKESLADKAYEAIYSLILDEGLNVGTPLSIDELARQLGVSSTPVREALVRMESEGLVELGKNRQAKVSSVSREELLSLYNVRQVLEPYLLVLLSECAKGNAAVREELQDLLKATHIHSGRLTASGGTPNHHGSPIKLDLRLGQILVRELRNPFLARLIVLINNYILRLRLSSATTPSMLRRGRLNQVFEEHAALLDAILAGDPQRIESAARHHLEMSRDRSLEALAESSAMSENVGKTMTANLLDRGR